MDRHPSLALSLIVLLPLLIIGCAWVPARVEPPSVHIADIRLLGASLFEQRYALSLRVQNPNDFDLPINGLSYEVELNDRLFATGASSHAVTVPRFGSALIEVEGVSTLPDLLRQYRQLARGELAGLHYRLKGTLSLRGGRGPIPFDYRGEIGLPDRAGKP